MYGIPSGESSKPANKDEWLEKKVAEAAKQEEKKGSSSSKSQGNAQLRVHPSAPRISAIAAVICTRGCVLLGSFWVLPTELQC